MKRSIAATVIAGSGKIWFHSLNGLIAGGDQTAALVALGD
jgi:hypothetical protein